MTLARASTTSTMTSDNSSGALAGKKISPLTLSVEGWSMKIGRTNKEQSGHIAGEPDPRLAQRIPATNVPCLQAMLLAFLHAAN
jgi:hypothetical protein